MEQFIVGFYDIMTNIIDFSRSCTFYVFGLQTSIFDMSLTFIIMTIIGGLLIRSIKY